MADEAEVETRPEEKGDASESEGAGKKKIQVPGDHARDRVGRRQGGQENTRQVA